VTAEVRCRHELLPGQCSFCKGMSDDELYLAAALGQRMPRAGARPAVTPSTRRQATFRSRCPGESMTCTQWIEPLELIYRSDDVDAWVCAGCAGLDP
jgi:hypothetical protein